MMIAPETFAKYLADESLEELIKTRNNLIKQIDEYENIPSNSEDETYLELKTPSQSTVYSVNHLYLAEICKLISNRLKEIED